jgi:Sulfotransferase family
VSLAAGRLLRFTARSKRRRRWAGVALRTVAPILPRREPPREPVFVVGSPRSGTTMLFEVLNRSPHVASLGGESHLLWELFHPSSETAWSSHRLGSEDVTGPEQRTLYWMIHALAGRRRYLDKSPRNSLRIPYLQALFPGAWFVFLKRDGRAAVSSLITGWRSDDRTFPGTPVPRRLGISGYGGTNWKFLVPPGWESFAAGKTLAEVCAFQWVAANEAILAARERVNGGRWVELAYEEFVQSPLRETGQLLDLLGLPRDERTLAFAGDLQEHVTRAVTPPRADKWREENPSEIEGVLPVIVPTMRRLGYEPDY